MAVLITVPLVLISLSVQFNSVSSAAGMRSLPPVVAHAEGGVAVRIDTQFLDEEEEVFKMDLMSWVHGHTSQIGTVSDSDVKAIVNSLKQMSRPESTKYPRVKVYNYQFGDDKNSKEKSFTREVLVYTDPDQRKQWILEIEELDLRQNLIIFKSGDMGFGFAKENTFFVLRKTMSKDDIYHYFHIAYILPNRKGKTHKDARDVEWDTIKPKDLLPVPLIYKEPKGVHETHCKPAECDLVESIFGTCMIKRLTCEDLKSLHVNGKDKERMDAMIREGQPFIMELAKGTSIDVRYMNPQSDTERRKRMLEPSSGSHRSVKKSYAFPGAFTYGVPEAIGSSAQQIKHQKRVARDSSLDEIEKVPEAQSEALERSPRRARPTEHDTQKSYFEDILDKIRKSPPAQYTVRQMECMGCDPIGAFFLPYEYTPLQLYVANNLIHDIFKSTPADSLFSPEAEDVMKENKFVPFIGYGTCPYSVKTILKAPKSLEIDDIVTYYAETVGADCEETDDEHSRIKHRIRELLTSRNHFLEIWPDKTIRMNKTSLLPKSQLLSTTEVHQMMVSMMLAVYTTEYQLLIINRIDHERMELPNGNQSARMRFLTKVVLYTMVELIRMYPHHVVKGLGFLLQVLEDKYLSLVVEFNAISAYDFQTSRNESQEFKDMNRHDRLQVMALKDFIISGSGHLAKGEGVLPAFTTFYNHNYERISNLLVEFGVDRRKKEKKETHEAKSKDAKRTTNFDDYEAELLKRVLGWGGENSQNSDASRRNVPQQVVGKNEKFKQ